MANVFTKHHHYPRTTTFNIYRPFDKTHPLASLLDPAYEYDDSEIVHALVGPMKTHKRPEQIDVLCLQRVIPNLPIRTINTEMRRATVWPQFTDALPYDLFFDRYAYAFHGEYAVGIRPELDPKPVYKRTKCNVNHLLERMKTTRGYVMYPYM